MFKTCLTVACLFVLSIGTIVEELQYDPEVNSHNMVGYLTEKNSEKTLIAQRLMNDLNDMHILGLNVYTANCSNSTMRVCTNKRTDNDLIIWYKDIQIPYRGDMNITHVANWVKKIVESQSLSIDTAEQLKNLVE
jgi:hypothetical protein